MWGRIEGVADWLYKLDQFFQLDHVNENTKVPLASIHLEGRALQWHQGYMKGRNYVNPSWEQYVVDITGRFGEPFDDPMAELMELKQIATVKEYHDEFDSIINRLQLSPANTLSCFVTGLSEELRSLVRMFNPATISQAYALAKIQEANLSKTQAKTPIKPPLLTTVPNNSFNKSGPSSYFAKTQSFPHKPMNTLSKQPVAPFKPNPNWKILSPAEMDERRSKGLCFFCDEKYEFGHRCKSKRPQLYHLEWEDLEEEQVDECEEDVDKEFSQISVNALAGITHYQNYEGDGSLRENLLDTGSTHNFIDTAVAKKLVFYDGEGRKWRQGFL